MVIDIILLQKKYSAKQMHYKIVFVVYSS